jgi:hypothetical protein
VTFEARAAFLPELERVVTSPADLDRCGVPFVDLGVRVIPLVTMGGSNLKHVLFAPQLGAVTWVDENGDCCCAERISCIAHALQVVDAVGVASKWGARLRAEQRAARAHRRVRSGLPPIDGVERAARYLQRLEPAVAGRCGRGVHCASYSGRIFRAAVIAVRGFDVDDEPAVALLREYAARCTPPLRDVRRLRRVVANARKSGRMARRALLDHERPRRST